MRIITFKALSLPRLEFAHMYSSDSYHNQCMSEQNFFEISYIAEGTLFIQMDDVLYSANKGDILCLPSNTLYTIHADSRHSHHTIGASITWTKSDNESNDFAFPLVSLAENLSPTIYAMIDSVIHKQHNYKNSPTRFSAKFFGILCELSSCYTKKQSKTLPSEQLYVQQAKEFIRHHLQTPLTQKSIASHLRISPEHLCRIFKKNEGITLIRYINILKLENIRSLVINKNIKLYDAAAAFGYSDPNYVSHLFKKIYGYNITDKSYEHPNSQV